MKRRSLPGIFCGFLIALISGSAALAQADIENVIVETYYISDAQDATDVIGGTLAQGSRTYRVFIELCPDCSLRSLYGDVNHALKIQSTTPFFNNLDRGKTYGHQINNSALDENTAALDSWLALGAASNIRMGTLKADDEDGSIIGGANNDGGSEGVPGGLLVNTDPDAGFPLTERDGLVPGLGGSVLPPNFNLIGEDPTVTFGTETVSQAFISNDVRIGCAAPGVKGPTPENRVLVAQLTTTGELSFMLNIEVQRPDGSLARYVASDSLLQPGETPNGLLNYPPVCGCIDPYFLEYDPTAGCDDGSCVTPIIFGCLDTLACNYDPGANFNVPQLCCYGPGNCNGLSVDLLCPEIVGIMNDSPSRTSLKVYPNPANEQVYFDWERSAAGEKTLMVHDLHGRQLIHFNVPAGFGREVRRIDLSGWPAGMYLISANDGHHWERSKLVIH